MKKEEKEELEKELRRNKERRRERRLTRGAPPVLKTIRPQTKNTCKAIWGPTDRPTLPLIEAHACSQKVLSK
jgi:hypothetical protein